VFDWLFEGRAVVYCLLGALAAVLLVASWMTRKRGLLIAVGVLAALAGLYFLLDRLVETPNEQIERKLNEMAGAVKARNPDGVVRHIAADFHFRHQDRAAFGAFVDRAIRHGLVDDLRVWEFPWPDGGNDQVRKVEFVAKPLGGVVPEGPFYRVKATFVRETDGEWRLQTFDLFNPAVDANRPIDMPGLP